MYVSKQWLYSGGSNIEYIDIGNETDNKVYNSLKVEKGTATGFEHNFTGTEFSDITQIDNYGLAYCFYQCTCTGLTSVSFPALTSISNYGMQSAFYQCTGLTSVSFPALTSISNYGMQSAFYQCTELTGPISFPVLTSVGTYGMVYAFNGCTGLTSVEFPALTTSGTSITGPSSPVNNPFYHCFYQCTGITEVHFPAVFADKSSYLTPTVLFGGTSTSYCNANLQILFDL